MDQPTEAEIQSVIRGSDSAAKERLVKYFEHEGVSVVGGLSNSTVGLVLGMMGDYMRGETNGEKEVEKEGEKEGEKEKKGTQKGNTEGEERKRKQKK
jgi:hypothetical protein